MVNKKILLILILAFVMRFWQFNQIPPSLFGDEVDTGYQAYSIFKTGRDYFGNLLPVHFQSFGDWRMPLYIYATVPFMAILGLTETATRLPALLFSWLQIPVVYWLAKEISKNEKVALLTAFFVTISPWHFHFSRIAFEVTLFNLLFLVGLLFFLRGVKLSKGHLFIISSLALGLSVYAYSTAKLFVPLLLVFLILIFEKSLVDKQKLVERGKQVAVSSARPGVLGGTIRILLSLLRRGERGIVRIWRLVTSENALCFLIPLIIIVFPMVWDILLGQGGARFSNISIFSDPRVPEIVRQQRDLCPWSGALQRITHNKVWVYTDKFINNYLTSFSTGYLFLKGDPSYRHNPIGRGQLYPLYFPFILIGASVFLVDYLKFKKTELVLPFLLLFLTPIPAALTQNGGSHAIRTYQFIPWWHFFAAIGVVVVLDILKKDRYKKIFWFVFGLVLALSVFSFYHAYFSHFPNQPGQWWHWWNYGYREIFEYTNQAGQNYDKIYLSPAYDPPIVYSLFYSRYRPQKIQQEITISPGGLGKYIFANPDLSFLATGKRQTGVLFVVTPGHVKAMGYELEDYYSVNILETVTYPNGEIAFVIFKTE